MPDEKYGPYIPWRESSFLNNPKLPSRILQDAVTVEVCPETQSSGCADGSGAAGVQKLHVRIQPDLDSEQLTRWVGGEVCSVFSVARGVDSVLLSSQVKMPNYALWGKRPLLQIGYMWWYVIQSLTRRRRRAAPGLAEWLKTRHGMICDGR